MTRAQWLDGLTMSELKRVRAEIIVYEAEGTGLFDRVNGEIVRREKIIAEVG